MNHNEGAIPQQTAHLEAMASTMREDLEEARVGQVARDRASALEGLLKGVLTKIERLKR